VTGPGAGARVVGLLVARELRLEFAGREALATVAPFAAAAVLLAGLSFGGGERVLAAVAPGVVWFVLLLAAAPLARLVAAAERAEGTWDLLRGLAGPTALLAGKTGGLWVQFGVVWALVQGLSAVLFPVAPRWPALLAGPLGTFGLAVLTVAFGAVLSGAPRRGGLLAVLVLPAAIPVLLAGTVLGTPDAPTSPWLALLAGYDLLVAAALWAVGPALMEE
jgi:heme exporter protein B